MQITDEMVEKALEEYHDRVMDGDAMRAALEVALGAMGWGASDFECIAKNLAAERRKILSAQSAEIARLREALGTIIGIENRDYGPDWEEIEEAREIARAALETKG